MNRDQAFALYAELGFRTVPLAPRGKRPLYAGWREAPRAAWATAPVDANVGIVTGARSGNLVVLDFDDVDGPARVLGVTPGELAERTLVVRTARGWHVYARGRRASGRVRGVDVKAAGGLVVAPPSVHAAGHVYAFLPSPRRVAALSEIAPAWVIPRETQHSGRAPRPPLEPLAAGPVDWPAVRAWISQQSERLQAEWIALERGDAGDRSRAEFAVAVCLAEGGFSQKTAVSVLVGMPGGKARTRGAAYASDTVRRAYALRGR